MHELFHTEDCGLSLLCRCCRAPVCERHLSRADRMQFRGELWPNEFARGFRTGNAGRGHPKIAFFSIVSETIGRLTRSALRGPATGASKTAQKGVGIP